MKYEDEVGLWVTGMLLLVVLGIIVSCFWPSHSNVKEEPKKVEEIPKYNLKVLAYIGPFMKVEIEEHWYLAGVGCRSITHMPSCPCYNKEKKDE